jgi:hypothetical protein
MTLTPEITVRRSRLAAGLVGAGLVGFVVALCAITALIAIRVQQLENSPQVIHRTTVIEVSPSPTVSATVPPGGTGAADGGSSPVAVPGSPSGLRAVPPSPRSQPAPTPQPRPGAPARTPCTIRLLPILPSIPCAAVAIG